jgi:hypothetical protein
MVVMTDQTVVNEYDDKPDLQVNNRAKEQAYRKGFLESARHIVRVWAHPAEPIRQPELKPVTVRELLERRRCDPFAEEEAAMHLRRRVRERFAVYGKSGSKCLGFRPGHAIAAARLRGRHQAMSCVTQL